MLAANPSKVGLVEDCTQVYKAPELVRACGNTWAEKSILSQFIADGLIEQSLSCGEVNSVKELLRKKNLDSAIERTFQKMQMVQRKVRGSEAEKDNLILNYLAMPMHLWSSSLFCILNSHDILACQLTRLAFAS